MQARHSKGYRAGSSCLSDAIQTSRIKAPHVGHIGRSTAGSGKEIVLKGARGHLDRLVCRSHADQGMPPTATEAVSGGRLQRPAQGNTREALIVPSAPTKGRVLPAVRGANPLTGLSGVADAFWERKTQSVGAKTGDMTQHGFATC